MKFQMPALRGSLQTLNLDFARYDYEATKGLGADRDLLPDAVRLLVYIRGLGRCAYCCRPLVFAFRETKKHFSLHGKVPSGMFQLDHVLPVSVGGRDNYRNYQPLCEFHNGFKFKAALIELHGAIQAARLGQTVAVDWKNLYRAWVAEWNRPRGTMISALPFQWYERSSSGRPVLRVPGLDEKSLVIDRPQSFAIEKGFYDRAIENFIRGGRFSKIVKMIEPERVNHNLAYQ